MSVNSFAFEFVKTKGPIKESFLSRECFSNGFVELLHKAVEIGLIKSTRTSDDVIYHL